MLNLPKQTVSPLEIKDDSTCTQPDKTKKKRKAYNDEGLDGDPAASQRMSSPKQTPPNRRNKSGRGVARSSSSRYRSEPRDVVCHICGGKYTKHSIDAHITKCERLWRSRQEQLPKAERRPVPKLEVREGCTLEERNRMALEVHNKSALDECQYCGRTFYPDRLAVHLKSCAGKHQTSSTRDLPSAKKPQSRRKPKRQPKDVICHICGRKYTEHSIGIHLPQCEKLWNQRQKLRPKSERKPAPALKGDTSHMSRQERNELALDIHRDGALVPCRYCDRTFYPDRLLVHMKSCARNHGAKAPELERADMWEAPKDGSGPRDAICHICGRKYTIHSINIHIPQCEALFLKQQEKLPVNQRKPLPKFPGDPDKMTLRERNEIAEQTFNDATLEQCQFCDRTFLPDRLVVHLRSCAKNYANSSGQERRSSSNSITSRASVCSATSQQRTTKGDKSKPKAPRDVLCHICGRLYTIHSIDIHLQHCQELYRKRQVCLPVPDQQPLPSLGDVSDLTLQERNERAQSLYNDSALVPCQYCDRTFYPDRLKVHLRSCVKEYQKEKQEQEQHKKKVRRLKAKRRSLLSQNSKRLLET